MGVEGSKAAPPISLNNGVNIGCIDVYTILIIIISCLLPPKTVKCVTVFNVGLILTNKNVLTRHHQAGWNYFGKFWAFLTH